MQTILVLDEGNVDELSHQLRDKDEEKEVATALGPRTRLLLSVYAKTQRPIAAHLALSENGRALAALRGGCIHVHVAENAFAVSRVASLGSSIDLAFFTRLAWSGDARLLAIANYDGSVRILNCPPNANLPLVPMVVIESALSVTIDEDEHKNNEAKSAEFFNPLASLWFNDHADHYTLFTITHSGSLRSYKIVKSWVCAEAESDANAMPPPPHLFWRKAIKVNPSVAVENCPIQLFFAVFLGNYVPTVSWAQSGVGGSIILSGMNDTELPCLRVFEPMESSPFFAPRKSPMDQEDEENFVIDITDNASKLIGIPEVGFFENLKDLLSDVSTHLFESVKSAIFAKHGSVVIQASLSPTSKSLLLTIDMEGVVGIWDLVSASFVYKFTAADLQSFRASLVTSDPSATVADTSDIPSVISLSWWAESSIALTFSDGFVCITPVPLATPAIYTGFYSHPEICAAPEKQLFILDSQRIAAETDSEPVSFLSSILTPPSRSLAGLPKTLSTINQSAATTASTSLVTLMNTTPETAVHLRVSINQIESALQICFTQNLSTDIVYKQVYLNQSAGDIDVSLLNRIEDTAWVMQVCFDLDVHSNARIAREALMIVISKSSSVSAEDVEREVEALFLEEEEDQDEETDHVLENGAISKMDLCLHRMRAFKHLDRLDTYEAIRETGAQPIFSVGDTGFVSMFTRFREMDLAYLAAWHAACGNLKAVEVLFMRYAAEVSPFRFSILEQIPISMVDGSLFLLPKCDHAKTQERVWWAVRPWRKSDWTETNTSFLELVREVDHDEGNMQTSLFSSLRGDAVEFPASAEFISQWYLNLALRIENETCETASALALLEKASSEPFSVPGVEGLMSELTTLSDILSHHADKVGKLSLNEILNMPVEEVLRMMLDPVKNQPDQFCARLQSSVVPFLKRRSSSSPLLFEEGTSVLDEYILELASEHIWTCARVFYASRLQLPSHEQLLHKTPVAFAKLILDCAYKATPAQDSLDVLHRLRQSLPQLSDLEKCVQHAHSIPLTAEDGWDDGFDVEPEPAILTEPVESTPMGDLVKRIALFESHLEAMELLQKYGIMTTLEYLTSSDFESATSKRLLVIRMARSLLPKQDETNDEDWAVLANDLAYVLNLELFKELDSKAIMKEYLKGILQDGRLTLAKRLLTSSDAVIPPDASEELVIDCAKELVDNADVGDMYRGYLKLAVDCLNILPVTPAIQKELSLIEASHQVFRMCSSFNVPPPLPIQIRLHPNRLDIISSLVNSASSPKSLDMRALLDMGRKLHGLEGLSAEQRRVDMSVRGIVANYALDRGDNKFAVKICEEMMGAVLSEATRVPSKTKTDSTMMMMQRSDDAWLVCVRLIREGRQENMSRDFSQRLIGFVLERCEPQGMMEVLDLIRRGNLAAPLGHDGDLTRLKLSDCLDHVHGALTEFPNFCKDMNAVVEGGGGLFYRHDFYSHDLSQVKHKTEYAFDGDIVKDSERKSYTELYLNIHFVMGCKVAFERRRNQRVDGNESDSNLDLFLLSLAQEHYKCGEVEMAFAILLDVESLDTLQSFFDSVQPNRMNDLLALYCLSIRCLMFLASPSDRGQLVLELLQAPPIELIRYIDSEFVRRAVVESGKESIPSKCIQLAATYANRTKTSKNDQITHTIVEFTGCNLVEFEANETYRHDTVLSVARRRNDAGLLDQVLSVSDGFGVSESKLAMEHLVWLFMDGDVSVEALQHGLVRYGGIPRDDELIRLTEIRSALAKGESHKLVTYYSFLSHRFAKNESLSQALQLRCVLEMTFAENEALFGGWDLDAVLAVNYKSEAEILEFYAAMAKNSMTLDVLMAFREFIPRFLSLRYLDIFPDEAELASTNVTERLSAEVLVQSLFAPFAKQKLEEADFEYQEDEIMNNEYKDMLAVIDCISIQLFQSVADVFIVGEQAIHAPIALRIELARRMIEQCLGNQAATEQHQQLNDALNHVLLIDALYHLHDDITGTSIPADRIQQFDLAYEDDKFETVNLCMKMVIAGTAPYLVRETCQLLETRIGDETCFEPTQIYSDSILAILGIPRINEHSNAFRSGVETASDALNRMIGSVFRFEYPSDGVQETPSEDAWDTEWESSANSDGIGAFVALIKTQMRDAILRVIDQQRALISAELRLDLISILQKYFEYQDIAEDQIQLSKLEMILQSVWSVEATEIEKTVPADFISLFQKLGEISTTIDHSEGLVQVLEALSLEFLAESEVKQCYANLMIVAARVKNFALVVKLRLSKFLDLERDDENRLLQTLKSHGSDADTEYIKHSLLSKAPEQVVSGCDLLKKTATNGGLLIPDRLLFALAVSNQLTCELASTPSWSLLVEAVTTSISPSDSTRFSEGYETLLKAAVLDLIISRQLSRAFDLVISAFRIPVGLLGANSARYGVLKGYLRRISSGVEVALRVESSSGERVPHFEGVDEGVFWDVVLDSIRRSYGSVSEGERVLEALKQQPATLPMNLLLVVAALAASLTVSAQCSTPRVRSEWSQLTPEQKGLYVRAIAALAAKPASNQYANPDIMGWHDFVITHAREAYWAHGNAQFYPYHRAMMWQFEQAMIATGIWPSNMGVPYFDWPAMSQNWWTSDLFTEQYLGNMNSDDPDHCVLTGPFAKGKYQVAFDVDNRRAITTGDTTCLRRNAVQAAGDDATAIANTMNAGSFAQFTSSTSGSYYDTTNYHSTGHFIFGGEGGDMSNASVSPNDPIFWLHHGYVDKYWWRWQTQCEQFLYDYGGTLMSANDPNGNGIDAKASADQYTASWPFKVQQLLNTQGGDPLCYTYSRSAGDVPLAPLTCPAVVKPSVAPTTAPPATATGGAGSAGASKQSQLDDKWLYTALNLLVKQKTLGSWGNAPKTGATAAGGIQAADAGDVVVFGRRDFNETESFNGTVEAATATVQADETITGTIAATIQATETVMATSAAILEPIKKEENAYIETINPDNSTTISYTLSNNTIEIPAGFTVYSVMPISATAINETSGKPKRFFPEIPKVEYVQHAEAPTNVEVGSHPCHLAYPILLPESYIESMGMNYNKYLNAHVRSKMEIDTFNADNCTTMFSPSSMMNFNSL
ncbi:hypothetical protein BJ741DRAFT_710022 [Chytriomyces cf. hyalinus JEL632]|nr:hypothetical protein BJ741DRAFT_710022 [Chytriomyces cf. hyalinus JEL632]